MRAKDRKQDCVSHSKGGVIEGQGGLQQNGSRAGELEDRQEGHQPRNNLPLICGFRVILLFTPL